MKCFLKIYCGVEQLVARQAHNLEAEGSSPSPATNKVTHSKSYYSFNELGFHTQKSPVNFKCCHRITVSTQDFHSCNRGSIPLGSTTSHSHKINLGLKYNRALLGKIIVDRGDCREKYGALRWCTHRGNETSRLMGGHLTI